MKKLFVLVGLIFLCGCSKKTLSGVFEYKNDVGFDRYDFRMDGTVLNTYEIDSDLVGKSYLSGKGNYVLQNEEVIADVIVSSGFDSTMTNHVVFKIDGNDLLRVSTIQKIGNTWKYSTDANQERYIKQTQ